MPNYIAQKQSLFGGVGAPNAPRSTIDIPGAIDALTSGATSLISQAMVRRHAENLQRIQQQQIQDHEDEINYQRGRDALADQRAERDYQDRRNDTNAELQLKGFIPASTQQQTSLDAVPDIGGSAITPLRPIAQAMGGAYTPSIGSAPDTQPSPSPIQGAMAPRPALPMRSDGTRPDAPPGANSPSPTVAPATIPALRLGTGTAPAVPGVQVTPSGPPPAATNETQPTPFRVQSYHPQLDTKTVNVPAHVDVTQSAAALAAAADRQRRVSDYIAAGIPADKAAAAVDDPTVASELLGARTSGAHVVQDASGAYHLVDTRTGAATPVLDGKGKPVIGKAPTDPEASAARVAERQRQTSWRSHYAAAVVRLQQPKTAPDGFSKVPGLSYDDAKKQATLEADDAYGPLGGGSTSAGGRASTPALSELSEAESSEVKFAADQIRAGKGNLAQAEAAYATHPRVLEALKAQFAKKP